MSVRCFVAIGSNMALPARQIDLALAALARVPDSTLVASSSLYRSRPMGPSDQPDYLNAAACLDTALDPFALLQELQRIERAQGRKRGGTPLRHPPVARWGPRTLDLDLLLYGDREIVTEALTIPHPGLHERDFVLFPLHEIAGAGLGIPGRGRLGDLLAGQPAYRLLREGPEALPA